MSDPLALLSIAIAARGGTVDGAPAARHVAAGFTLLRRCAPLVRALGSRRSAILLPTSHQYFTALAASDGRGAVLINPLAAPAEIAYQLADADVGAVFTVSALAAGLPDGVTHVLLDEAPRVARVVLNGSATDVDLGSHSGLRLEGRDDADGLDEECAIVYTSAMAGRPLGAILTHRNLIANARQTVEAAELTSGDHCLAVLPWSHLFGLTVTGVATLTAGGRVSTMARFNPVAAVNRLQSDEVTMLVGVPAVFSGILAAIDRRGGGLGADALRLCICGGAELPPALQQRWFEATGVELRQGYGLTEASPVCLFNRTSQPNRRGSLGVPFPGCEVTIRHPRTGEELPDGAPGEICVRGATVFRGYVSGGEAGLGSRDGWLGTGDLGARSHGGAVSFLGLLKEMFTRNGFNIYPKELERVIGAMPLARGVRVYAIPAAGRENDIGVDVEGSVTEDAVRDWCRPRLSAYKQPTVVRLVS